MKISQSTNEEGEDFWMCDDCGFNSWGEYTPEYDRCNCDIFRSD